MFLRISQDLIDSDESDVKIARFKRDLRFFTEMSHYAAQNLVARWFQKSGDWDTVFPRSCENAGEPPSEGGGGRL